MDLRPELSSFSSMGTVGQPDPPVGFTVQEVVQPVTVSPFEGEALQPCSFPEEGAGVFGEGLVAALREPVRRARIGATSDEKGGGPDSDSDGE